MHTYLCVSASSHTTGLSRPATPARSRRNVVRSMQKSSRRAPSCARWHLVRRAIIGGDGGRPGVTPLVALHVFSHAPVDACRAPGDFTSCAATTSRGVLRLSQNRSPRAQLAAPRPSRRRSTTAQDMLALRAIQRHLAALTLLSCVFPLSAPGPGSGCIAPGASAERGEEVGVGARVRRWIRERDRGGVSRPPQHVGDGVVHLAVLPRVAVPTPPAGSPSTSTNERKQ